VLRLFLFGMPAPGVDDAEGVGQNQPMAPKKKIVSSNGKKE
jgi:hypothetical protein